MTWSVALCLHRRARALQETCTFKWSLKHVLQGAKQSRQSKMATSALGINLNDRASKLIAGPYCNLPQSTGRDERSEGAYLQRINNSSVKRSQKGLLPAVEMANPMMFCIVNFSLQGLTTHAPMTGNSIRCHDVLHSKLCIA